MSTMAQSDADAESETKKTVNVTAYAAEGAFKSERAMADALIDGTDFYDRRRKKNRTVELVYDDGETEVSERVYHDEVRDALVEGGVDHDHLTVTDETEVSRPYAHSPGEAVTSIRNDIFGELPDELSGGLTAAYSGRWQNDDWTTLVRIRDGSLDHRRVLLHRSERDGRRKYETDRKHLSMDFTIEMGPATEATVETWTEEVVKPFIKRLSKMDWCWKVRVTDCMETVEREGDCFNAL